jgi:hypothetical protein
LLPELQGLSGLIPEFPKGEEKEELACSVGIELETTIDVSL